MTSGSGNDWQQVDAAIAQLESLWQKSEDVDLSACLPEADSPYYQEVLLALIPIDQEFRWRLGNPKPLEQYLQQWPALRESPTRLQSLVEAECLTRALASEQLRSDEIEARFPGIGVKLNLDKIRAEATLRSRTMAMTEAVAEQEPSGGNAHIEHVSKENAPALRGQFGTYELVRELGEGGFGTVHLARQTSPIKRDVAIKIIKPGMDTRQVLARFEAERQALALMNHPSIAKVYDAGETDNSRSFFVMEAVEGATVTNYCDEQRLTIDDRLRVFTSICEGIQHAHQKGIIHRDIKPTNVLISTDDISHHPKIIDFGIAKALAEPLTDHSVLTHEGQLLGTPAYMSPEQMGEDTADIDTRSDVYSLGVLLYELLTGELPFSRASLRAAGLDGIRRMVCEVEPPQPSQRVSTSDLDTTDTAKKRRVDTATFQRKIRGELDWIVMKALEKDRDRRYASAADLAQDVQRYLSHEPVDAGPPSAKYRLKKLVRKHRVGLLVAALIISLLVAGTATSSFFAVESAGNAKKLKKALENVTDQRNRANSREREAVDARGFAERQQYFTTIRLATLEIESGNFGEAQRMLRGCKPELRDWEWGYLLAQCPQPLWTTQFGNLAVKCLSVSPDSSLFAASNGHGEISVFDAESQEVVWRKLLDRPSSKIAFAQGGSVLVVLTDGKLLILNASDGKVVRESKPLGLRDLCIAPSQDRVSAITVPLGYKGPSEIQVIPLATCVPTQVKQLHEEVFSITSFDGGDSVLCGVGAGGSVRKFDASTLEYQEELLSTDGRPVRCIATDPRVNRAVCGERALVWLIDDDPSNERMGTPHSDWIMAVDVHPSRDLYLSVDRLARAKVSGWDDDQPVFEVRQAHAITAARFLGDGILTADTQGRIRYWSLDDSRPKPILELEESFPTGNSLSFASDGKLLATCGWPTGTVDLWDTGTWQCRTIHIDQNDDCRLVRFRPHTHQLAVGSKGFIRILNVDSNVPNEILRIESKRGKEPWSGSFNADGRYLAVSFFAWAAVFDLEDSGKRIFELPIDGELCFADINSAGTILAVGTGSSVTLWSMPDGKKLHELKSPSGSDSGQHVSYSHGGGCVSFSPDGRQVASGNWQGVLLWDTASGELTQSFLTSDIGPERILFSHSGRRLVVSTSDRRIRVCDIASGRVLLTARNSSYWSIDGDFSPDGNLLATTGIRPAVSVRKALPWSVDGEHEVDIGSDSLSTLDADITYGEWKRAVDNDRDKIHALMARFHKAKDRGDYDAASTLIDQAISLDAEDALILAERGFLRNLYGDKVQAREDLNKASSIDPQLAAQYFEEGKALREKQDWKRARTAFGRAMVLLSDAEPAYTAFLQACMHAGEPKLAADKCDDKLNRDPLDFKSWYRLCLMRADGYPRQTQSYRQTCHDLIEKYRVAAQEQDGQTPPGWNVAWCCKFAQINETDLNQAVVLARHSVELQPDDVRARHELACILCRAGEYEESSALQSTILSAPESREWREWPFLWMAIASFQNSQQQSAEDYLRQAESIVERKSKDGAYDVFAALELKLLVAEAQQLIGSGNAIVGADKRGSEWKPATSVGLLLGRDLRRAIAAEQTVESEDQAQRLLRILDGTDRAAQKVPLPSAGYVDGVTTLAFNRDGTILATGAPTDAVCTWSTTDWNLIGRWPCGYVNTVVFSPNNRYLAWNSDNSVTLGDPDELMPARQLQPLQPGYLKDVRFNVDGSRLAAIDAEGNAFVWSDGMSVPAAKELWRPMSFFFTPSTDGLASLAGMHAVNPRAELKALNIEHDTTPKDTVFSGSGRYVAHAETDGSIRVWDLADPSKRLQTFRMPDGATTCIAISLDGSIVAAGNNRGRLTVWNVSDNEPVWTIQADGLSLDSVAISPDTSLVAASGWEDNVVIYDAESGEKQYAIPRLPDALLRIAFSPDGSKLAFASDSHTVEVWDFQTETLRPFSDRSGALRFRGLAFSQDGKSLHGGDYQANVYEWNVESGEQLRETKTHGEDLFAFAYSPCASKWPNDFRQPFGGIANPFS
jgi:serine/threonine protein kinase/WD40 repeat protein/tetratricopeptide (TPR) repeat protein